MITTNGRFQISEKSPRIRYFEFVERTAQCSVKKVMSAPVSWRLLDARPRGHQTTYGRRPGGFLPQRIGRSVVHVLFHLSIFHGIFVWRRWTAFGQQYTLSLIIFATNIPPAARGCRDKKIFSTEPPRHLWASSSTRRQHTLPGNISMKAGGEISFQNHASADRSIDRPASLPHPSLYLGRK